MSAKQISEEVLDRLVEMRESLAVQEALLNKESATFRAEISEALRDVKAPISTSVICLDCGEIRNIRLENCPSCTEAPAPAAAPNRKTRRASKANGKKR